MDRSADCGTSIHASTHQALPPPETFKRQAWILPDIVGTRPRRKIANITTRPRVFHRKMTASHGRNTLAKKTGITVHHWHCHAFRSIPSSLPLPASPSLAHCVILSSSYLPEFGTDLVTALSGLDVNDLSHGDTVCFVDWLCCCCCGGVWVFFF